MLRTFLSLAGCLAALGGCYRPGMVVQPVPTGDQKVTMVEGTSGLLRGATQNLTVFSDVEINRYGTGFLVVLKNDTPHPIPLDTDHITVRTESGQVLAILSSAEILEIADHGTAKYNAQIGSINNPVMVGGAYTGGIFLARTRAKNIVKEAKAVNDIIQYARDGYMMDGEAIQPGETIKRRFWVKLPSAWPPSSIWVEVEVNGETEVFVFELGDKSLYLNKFAMN